MKKEKHIYDILPVAIVIISLFIWLVTEILSAFCALTHRNVVFAWVIGLLCGIMYFVINTRKKNLSNTSGMFNIKEIFRDWTLSEDLLLLLSISLSGTLSILSYHIVPNNWDSMTYHLPRVMNWIENGSVAYYPTNNPRQLYYSNFSEYVILHIMLIFQNDQLVNLVQWFAYVVSGYMLYRIVLELKLKRVYALLAELLYMLCPMAIAESVTTQVDLVGTMWCLIFAYFALKIGKSNAPLNSRDNLTGVAFCAASIGLGYLTKSSVCFVMPFILIWLLAACVVKREKTGTIVSCSVLGGGSHSCLDITRFYPKL